MFLISNPAKLSYTLSAVCIVQGEGRPIIVHKYAYMSMNTQDLNDSKIMRSAKQIQFVLMSIMSENIQRFIFGCGLALCV